ncbi:sensor histidine kinase [Actinomadura logoneensis]|uniref:histidine kinase n=1 Tax=Actinomadura logoneensis TaxID=2293572 RepID=A0A372JNM9_9ACTN|nr:sensor histidine kinase [Actinomadura logoneensis]RFU40948.1 sensor histidine kinase [Actinomadura logoneensis]
MSSEEERQGAGVAATAGLLARPLAAAFWRGRAEPADPDPPWPFMLRWTRFIGVGRLPYGLVAQGFDLLVAVILLFSGIPAIAERMVNHVPVDPFDVGPPPHPAPAPSPTFPVVLLAVWLAAPLALRRRHPLGAWRLGASGVLVAGLVVHTDDRFVPSGVIAMLFVLFLVAVRCSRETTVGVALVTVLGSGLLQPRTAAGAAVLVAVPLLVGFLVRTRRTSRRELEQQERRHRDAEAVLLERQRIARELHDVVAHHMSMIAIQAEAAPYKTPDVPPETRDDLAEIRATALDALREMRRILGVLRQEDGAVTAPQPSLEHLDELLAGARGTGLEVSSKVTGDVSDLPPGVGLTAYRIVQEALSNAMRHAPGSAVGVEVARAGGILRLSVVNGPAAPGHPRTPSPPGSGHGLVGMRERVAMLGGELSAVPIAEGGFAVTATLPETAPPDDTAVRAPAQDGPSPARPRPGVPSPDRRPASGRSRSEGSRSEGPPLDRPRSGGARRGPSAS